MSRIFISYRRQDSLLMTGRIYDKLESVFGSNKVFRDIDDISAGEDFRAKLAKEIDKCDILLVIIGPKWENISDGNGNRRLDDPNDFVRLEVEAGLNCKDKIVIPVLVENAPMPGAATLPENLRELCYRNASSIRQDPDFHHDIQRLIQQIKNIERASLPFYKKKPFLIGAGLAMLLFLIGVVTSLWSKPAIPVLTTDTPTSRSPLPNMEFVTATASPPLLPQIIATETAITAITSVTTPTLEVTNTPFRPIRIGVILIPDYKFTDVLLRLQSLGFEAEWIGASSDYSAFSKYDVVYLPIGWAFQKLIIEDHALQYKRFVEEGGGLIVEQPNSSSSLTPDLLPYKLTFKQNQYDPNEWPPRIINEHEIIAGVPVSELPGPGNKISANDENWTVITSSAQLNIPTLLVAEYAKGRVAALGTSVSEDDLVRYRVGDKFIKQLISWVNQ
jgi:hypothetical protein